MDKYLVTTTFTLINHLSFDEAKQLALKGRGEGKRTELATIEQLERSGFGQNMQDLRDLNSWTDVARCTR